jgi:hypothetical protein
LINTKQQQQQQQQQTSSSSMGLEEVYTKFASFGKGVNGAQSGMDGKAFAKFCKDSKLLTTKLTPTDVDLIFANTKVKPKTERKITYDQFLIALELVAEKKGLGVEALVEKITQSNGPQLEGVQKADASGIYDKLTDSNQYTGAHKSRFNSDGTGKGLDGRDSIPKGTGTTKTATTKTSSPATKRSTSPSKTSTATKKVDHSPKSTKTATSSGIFARLTDSKQYTGAHKHRFDEEGKGKGSAGRDVGGNGGGTHGGKAGDLSSMTRTNLN